MSQRLLSKIGVPHRRKEKMNEPTGNDTAIETWRQIIVGDTKSWALFENGTCVILMEPEEDLAEQARDLLKEWGPVQVGTPSADFNVVELQAAPGWVVTCHHPDILTYVAPDEMSDGGPSEVMIGLIGRSKRDQDASDLHVIHVENKKNNPA